MLKKIITAVLFVISLCALLTSCSLSADDVKLSDAKQCKKYAEDNYCECELISSYESDGEHKYEFRDTECGFSFYVTSCAVSMGMDGTTFYYHERTSSNYDTEYCKWVVGSVKAETDALAEEYGMNIEWEENPYTGLAEITIDTADPKVCEDAAVKLGQLIKNADRRSRYSNCEIPFIGSDHHLLGTFKFESMTFEKFDRDKLEELKAALEGYTGFEMEYVWNYQTNFEDLYKIGGHTRQDGSDGPVTVYYFNGGGKQWYITDAVIEDGTYYYFMADEEYLGYEG